MRLSKMAVPVFLAMCCAFLPGVPELAAAVARPNIVMILVDDLDRTTSPYWDALPKTARLLRDQGLTFAEDFAPTSICCPARATILTGKYGHNTGVLTNRGDQGGWETFVKKGNEQRTVAKYLSDAGYRTALVGKYLNGIEGGKTHVPPGWSEWYAGVSRSFYSGYGYELNENGKIVKYGRSPNDYSTDVLAAKSVDFIERSGSDPFFLFTTPTAPHTPLGPAPRHADHAWAKATAPRRPNFQEQDVSDKPSWLRQHAAGRALEVAVLNDADYRKRMGSLLAVDDMVEGIVRALERTGQLDNTYLFFVSDNGYNLGAHRLVNKMAPYEESIRVPAVVAGPGIRKGTVDRMTLHTDLAPTFLELAGVPVPSDVDGSSLVPILHGKPVTRWRDDFLVQYVGGGAAGVAIEDPGVGSSPYYLLDIPTYRGLRTTTHLYVEWYAKGKQHEYELYDLRQDPYELNNLLSTSKGRQQNAKLVRRLQARLVDLAACRGVTCR